MKTFGNENFYRHLHGPKPLSDAFKKLDPRLFIQRLNSGEVRVWLFWLNLKNKILGLI